MKPTVFATVLSFIVLACSDSQAPQMAPQLQITAGNNQSAAVGKELPGAVRALLSDNVSGAPLAGRVVNWVVVAGDGSVFASATETGPDGIAAQRWTLGGIVGEQRLVVRWVDPETGLPVTIDTAKATAMPGVATQFEANFGPNPNAGPNNVWTVGDTVIVEYNFFDEYRNPTTVCADGGSVDRVVWTSSNESAMKPLGTVRAVGGKRYAEFLAQASSPTDAVILTGDPSDLCSGASAMGVSGFVR